MNFWFLFMFEYTATEGLHRLGVLPLHYILEQLYGLDNVTRASYNLGLSGKWAADPLKS